MLKVVEFVYMKIRNVCVSLSLILLSRFLWSLVRRGETWDHGTLSVAVYQLPYIVIFF